MGLKVTTLQIQTAKVFQPLLNENARDLGAHGGRGSGKSHFFADTLIERCIMEPTRWVCGREVQKSIRDSVKLLLEDKIRAHGLSSHFEILESEIRCPNDGKIIFTGMLQHTIDSIKSLEGFDGFWGTEAQSFSQRSIDMVRPTIRRPKSQLWWDWNPETKKAPVDLMLRGPNKLSDVVVVQANWRDNPWFPEVLRKEMEAQKLADFDKYMHIWEGEYRMTLDGAVYAKELREAYADKRITKVLPIPGKPVETFWDLGKRDHTAIWFAQMQLGEYRIIRYYQNRGQQLQHYAEYLRETGYALGKIWFPHDADQERIVGKTPANAMRDLFPNISVQVIPRMNKKAIGIEAVRRIFGNCVFDEHNCEDGLEALANFKFDVDEDTGGYSQNPLHDEFSDGADAFAQLALSLKEFKKASVADFSLDGRMAL